MNFIKTVIRKCIYWATDDNDLNGNYKEVPMRDISVKAKNPTFASPGISTNTFDAPGSNFTIYNAVGGKIVQFGSYNQNTDRYTSALYIIHNNTDMGQELAEILTAQGLSS